MKNFITAYPKWWHHLCMATENHKCLCQYLWLALQSNPKFRLRIHHLNVFGFGSSSIHPKLLGLRLHSPTFYYIYC